MSAPTIHIACLITKDNHIMRSHLVHGVSILPGVVLLDMICRLADKHLGPAERALRNVTYANPIATSEEFDQSVAVRFVGLSDGGHAVTVEATKTKNGRALDADATPILECHMGADVVAGSPPELDVNAFIQSADRAWDMADTYAMVRRAQIVHGDFMRASGTLYHKGGEALARLRLGALAESYRDHFLAHPVFLDASTSLPFSFRLGMPAHEATETDPYIPFSIRRFRIRHRLPAEVYVHSPGREETPGADGKPDLVSTDIRIFDAEGRLLVEFDRVSGKRIRERRLISKLVREESSPQVRKSAANGAAPGASPTAAPTAESAIREFLATVIASELGEATALARDESFYELGLDSANLLRLTKKLEVRCGCRLYPTFLFEYKTIDEVTRYVLEHHRAAFDAADGAPGSFDAARAEPAKEPESIGQSTESAPALSPHESFAARPVWERRAARPLAGAPSRRVVLVRAGDGAALVGAGALGSEVTVWPDEGVDLGDAFSRCAARLLAHVQGLLAERSNHAIAVQVLSCDDDAGGAMAGLAALLRSIHLENPKIVGQVVLVPRGEDRSRVAAWLEDEAATGRPGLIRYAGGDRFVQSWVEQDLAGVDAAGAPLLAPWRAGAAYLVTGGGGGLGRLVACEIASHAPGATIHLCGRSPLVREAEPLLAELRRMGANPVYTRADIADAAHVDVLFRAIANGPPLAGVVHAAGVLRDNFVLRKTSQEVAEVLAPKVRGALLLDEATKGMPLDVFILFAAMAGFVGSPGQADYAAANAFLDTFAASRERLRALGQRAGRTLSVDWSLWAEGGMRVAVANGERGVGMAPLRTADAFAAMYAALASGQPQIAIAAGERSRLRGFVVERLGPPATVPVAYCAAAPRPASTVRADGSGPHRPLDIAVIGISGAYPGASDVDELWNNLASGRDCITEVPPDRWDWREYFSSDRDNPGHHHCKWGGFLSGVDQFDARFFHISPREAEGIDPQERLFLEHAWRAMEDAGYRRRDLQLPRGDDLPGQVGVYAGVMFSEYPLFAAEASARGTRVAFASGMASVANRVSYFLNLHGPSMTVDTMCSGAMTSTQLACQDLMSGRVDMAFAGAVNLTIHPNKYLMLSAAQFIAPEGRCASFGVGGDGYVPGEGVGVIVLKRLADAERDGDHVYGVIKAVALNHGGKSSGFSVPNPPAQEMVIRRALREATVDPRTVSYVEAHGTGTKLGDPIEITALTKAFGAAPPQSCWVGSVKSNVGHCEAAAAIVGITKVLLQMREGKIAPSLHSSTLNPHIDFASTPFVVNQSLRDWVRPVIDGREYPRRAGVSSFGAGGSNAHVVVEEYLGDEAPSGANDDNGIPLAIVLSAKTEEQVRLYARKLLAFFEKEPASAVHLARVAYTLQVGREPMEVRLGMLVRSRAELCAALARVAVGELPDVPHALGAARADASGASATGAVDAKDPWTAVERWVAGADVDWRQLYVGRSPKRASLPTYPFKRSRHWLPDKFLPKKTPEAPEKVSFRSAGATRTISLGER